MFSIKRISSSWLLTNLLSSLDRIFRNLSIFAWCFRKNGRRYLLYTCFDPPLEGN
uniref:HVA22K n=1 Tax=Arundo donax TaxID=35708 RepID=A0A0A9E746_ARUDO